MLSLFQKSSFPAGSSTLEKPPPGPIIPVATQVVGVRVEQEVASRKTELVNSRGWQQ